VRCKHCDRDVADGLFCARCGASQSTSQRLDRPTGTHRYAAYPAEHVVQPSVITTLFPHLGTHAAHEFRLALLGGTLVVFVLYVGGLIAGALLAAAFLIPVLYLLYLNELRLMRHRLVREIAASLGGGVVLGVLFSMISSWALTPVLVEHSVGDADIWPIAALIIGLALAEEIVKPIPALLLRRNDRTLTIHGLTFGIAAGIGFAVAASVVEFSPVFASEGLRSSPANWIYPLITVALLLPVVHATTTGLVTASLWKALAGSAGKREAGAIAVAATGHVLFWLGAPTLAVTELPEAAAIVWQAIVVGALLIATRYVLHFALFEEGADPVAESAGPSLAGTF
jgi:hypothetical protein